MTDSAVESHQAILFNMVEHSVDSTSQSAISKEIRTEVEAHTAKQAEVETPKADVAYKADSDEQLSFLETETEAALQAQTDQVATTDESQEVVAVEALNQDDMELSAPATQEEILESETPIIHKAGNVTLPAALCDDELLTELASIPSKMGFKIGEVAEMLGIKQYVLRYWETEFDVLKPKKAANNQRYYTKKDVENVYLIRKLLHRDRFSIEGARSALKDLKNVVKKEKDWSSVNHKVENLQERVENFVTDLRKLRRMFEA